ncbi:MAG: hypothetical protein KGR48_00090 [Alphaproteobacteria bacterium]|nr:hypothetical protein [Alphaproteobacteria bacterium]MDE2013923.1 hypothetical protein [Alphaproteobacteria bacterium]MDE2072458.1 hypothetical protein [Alphaproteobacteria bacterium]MDE2351631.1 hypothetical protein [Alphaproteobacteria bacterium]
MSRDTLEELSMCEHEARLEDVPGEIVVPSAAALLRQRQRPRIGDTGTFP